MLAFAVLYLDKGSLKPSENLTKIKFDTPQLRYSKEKIEILSKNIFKINFKMTIFSSLLNLITLGIFWKIHIFYFIFWLVGQLSVFGEKIRKILRRRAEILIIRENIKEANAEMEESAEKKIPKGRERKGERAA